MEQPPSHRQASFLRPVLAQRAAAASSGCCAGGGPLLRSIPEAAVPVLFPCRLTKRPLDLSVLRCMALSSALHGDSLWTITRLRLFRGVFSHGLLGVGRAALLPGCSHTPPRSLGLIRYAEVLFQYSCAYHKLNGHWNFSQLDTLKKFSVMSYPSVLTTCLQRNRGEGCVCCPLDTCSLQQWGSPRVLLCFLCLCAVFEVWLMLSEGDFFKFLARSGLRYLKRPQ